MLKYYLLAVAVRLALLVYGEWQDRTMAVKFTDVDYYVFTDAASFVAEGKSPYLRATFRYTPVLAYMLLPSVWAPIFGKILFIMFDVLAGMLMHSIMRSTGSSPKLSLFYSSLWLFNPLPITVSSRGNAESVMAVLVLLTLQLLYQRQTFAAAVTYAMAVHFKIYPVTYALPIYLLLGKAYSEKEMMGRSKIKSSKSVENEWNFPHDLLPNKERVTFIVVGVLTLAGLTGCFYLCYGWDFLFETYLYHIVRGDIHHNFSPYFYMLYLTEGLQISAWIKILAFFPQVILLLAVSFKFYKDPPFCWFLNTFIFVALNKVCTSQYFLWYLCLLPLIVPRIKVSLKMAAILTGLWFLGQGIWLLPAYYLEFQGVNSFIFLWLAGLIFFIINMWIVLVLVTDYRPPSSSSSVFVRWKAK